MRVLLTVEAQAAMLSLIKRARGKKVEYGLQLLLDEDRIYPGKWKWGSVEKIRASFSGIGWFHTHPMERRMKLAPKFARGLWEEELVERPARLSSIDILHVFVSPEHRIVGVGGTEIFQVKLVPYELEESVEVRFATLVKPVPPVLRLELLGLIPIMAALGDIPVEGIEEYYELYTFDLTSTRSYPMEVHLG
ncbi:unnamed protein product [marine sediment metagenome]|uniref:Uncharacterized protein n=1 Tax=marine sediment metagenome TaxID=412755 RepID=X1RGR6_9ZZZZ